LPKFLEARCALVPVCPQGVIATPARLADIESVDQEGAL
jgi:hypothetical protein